MRDRLVLPLIGGLSSLVVLGVAVVLVGQWGAPGGGLDVSALPTVNAFLNGMSAVLLGAGYVFVRRKRVSAHRACMLAALGVSSLFLISYLIYHWEVGSVPFGGKGAIRAVYFSLLISHIALAASIVPLALTAVYRAWAGQLDKHRRIARWTLPLWLYVSVSGVIVYWMLHRLPLP